MHCFSYNVDKAVGFHELLQEALASLEWDVVCLQEVGQEGRPTLDDFKSANHEIFFNNTLEECILVHETMVPMLASTDT